MNCQMSAQLSTLMYADDTVIFTYAENPQAAAQKLTTALTHIQEWLIDSCLSLNAKKTVCMTFTKSTSRLSPSKIYLRGEELQNVSEFKYLGVVLDSTLSFKNHVKSVVKTVNFNLLNFKQIRSSLSDSASLTFLHSMILSHIDYCITSWSYTCDSILRSIESCFKKALKVLDKKPLSYHHCSILDKYNFLNFTNLKYFKSACLIYKILHGLAPPPLNEFIKQRSIHGSTSRVTRATDRGDCEFRFRRTSFAQNTLSFKGCAFWNSIPPSVRECSSFISFKKQLKLWLRGSQICDHV